MDTGRKSKMAETNPFDLPSELPVLGHSGCSRPRLRAAKANWKTVTFLQQHSKQQEFKHHCHGIATLQEHLKILIKYFLWADVIQPMCLLISTWDSLRTTYKSHCSSNTFLMAFMYRNLEALLQGLTSYLKGYCCTWHLDSYLSFITQLIYLILQWKNVFVGENTTWISSSFLHQIRPTLRGKFPSLSATRIPLNRRLCLSFSICEDWRSIWFSEFLFDSRKYVADSAQFHFSFLGPFDLKAQKYAKPHDI